ncbi:MAG: CoA transferase, partial [Actinobacteria bacterium]|nr:CoA transferase [Actinomycetota bacterium]
QVLGIEASTDQRFATNTSRVANRTELNTLLTGVLTQKSAAEWIVDLTKVGVPAGLINTIEEAVKLAESLDLNPIISIKDFRDGHQSRSIANPIKFSKTPVEYPFGPPSLGMDD